MLLKKSFPLPTRKPENNNFRFGNGATELSSEAVTIPCCLAGKRGVISAAIVRGKAPLLISALQSLKACLDFQHGQIRLFDEQVCAPLMTNAAGQYVIDLLPSTGDDVIAPPLEPAKPTEEPMPDELPATASASSAAAAAQDKSPQLHQWIREDWGASHTPISAHHGPTWQNIRNHP